MDLYSKLNHTSRVLEFGFDLRDIPYPQFHALLINEATGCKKGDRLSHHIRYERYIFARSALVVNSLLAIEEVANKNLA